MSIPLKKVKSMKSSGIDIQSAAEAAENKIETIFFVLYNHPRLTNKSAKLEVICKDYDYSRQEWYYEHETVNVDGEPLTLGELKQCPGEIEQFRIKAKYNGMDVIFSCAFFEDMSLDVSWDATKSLVPSIFQADIECGIEAFKSDTFNEWVESLKTVVEIKQDAREVDDADEYVESPEWFYPSQSGYGGAYMHHLYENEWSIDRKRDWSKLLAPSIANDQKIKSLVEEMNSQDIDIQKLSRLCAEIDNVTREALINANELWIITDMKGNPLINVRTEFYYDPYELARKDMDLRDRHIDSVNEARVWTNEAMAKAFVLMHTTNCFGSMDTIEWEKGKEDYVGGDGNWCDYDNPNKFYQQRELIRYKKIEKNEIVSFLRDVVKNNGVEWLTVDEVLESNFPLKEYLGIELEKSAGSRVNVKDMFPKAQQKRCCPYIHDVANPELLKAFKRIEVATCGWYKEEEVVSKLEYQLIHELFEAKFIAGVERNERRTYYERLNTELNDSQINYNSIALFTDWSSYQKIYGAEHEPGVVSLSDLKDRTCSIVINPGTLDYYISERTIKLLRDKYNLLPWLIGNWEELK